MVAVLMPILLYDDKNLGLEMQVALKIAQARRYMKIRTTKLIKLKIY